MENFAFNNDDGTNYKQHPHPVQYFYFCMSQ